MSMRSPRGSVARGSWSGPEARGSAWDLAVVATVASLGCAGSPDAPLGPTDAEPSVWVVRLSGVPVGTVRAWRVDEEGGARVLYVRSWSVRLRDEPIAWTTTVDAHVDGDGRLVDLVVTRDG